MRSNVDPAKNEKANVKKNTGDKIGFVTLGFLHNRNKETVETKN